MSNFLLKLSAGRFSDHENSFCISLRGAHHIHNPIDRSLYSFPQIGDKIYLWEHEDPRNGIQGRGLIARVIIERIADDTVCVSMEQRIGNSLFGINDLDSYPQLQSMIKNYSHDKLMNISDETASFLDSRL